MKDHISRLPEDFSSAHQPCVIHHYQTDKSSVKNKVIFTQSAICILIHGVKDVYSGTAKKRISDQQILLLSPGCTLMTERLAENNRYEALILFLDAETIADCCIKMEIGKGNNTSGQDLVLTADKDEFLLNYERSLLLLKQARTSALDQVKIEELVRYLYTRHPDLITQFFEQAFRHQTTINLQQVVLANQDRGLTISELAFLCHMSISTFKRRFKAQYHLSPQKYFAAQKMQRAKQLLFLNKRATDIYSELGYESLSSFSNEFKKHFGMSPNQCARQNEHPDQVSGLPA